MHFASSLEKEASCLQLEMRHACTVSTQPLSPACCMIILIGHGKGVDLKGGQSGLRGIQHVSIESSFVSKYIYMYFLLVAYHTFSPRTRNLSTKMELVCWVHQKFLIRKLLSWPANQSVFVLDFRGNLARVSSKGQVELLPIQSVLPAILCGFAWPFSVC